MTGDDTLEAVERWFRSRGIPLHPAPDASPAATPRLGRRQWGNVGLVVLFTQGLQIPLVSAMIGLFFVGFGLLTITPATAELRQAFAVRAVCLAARARDGGRG